MNFELSENYSTLSCFGNSEEKYKNLMFFIYSGGFKYLHSEITREESERILYGMRRENMNTGTSQFLFFLVRESTSVRGAVVLSHENPAGGFRHFLIPVDRSECPMKFLHNLNGQCIRHLNLTNLIHQYFQITGIPGVAIADKSIGKTFNKLETDAVKFVDNYLEERGRRENPFKMKLSYLEGNLVLGDSLNNVAPKVEIPYMY